MDIQKKMTLLQDFLNKNPDTLDLRFISDISSFPFQWKHKIMNHLFLFAKTGTGSYIGFWSYNKPIDILALNVPLVWIDHEGIPMSVFANTFDEFLELIYYDSGLIYEILISEYFFKSDPTGYQKPENKFTESYLKKYLKSLTKEKSPNFKYFGLWLKETLDIQPTNNPTHLIKNAINNNQDFEHWIALNNK